MANPKVYPFASNNHYLTEVENLKLFIEYSGFLWKQIKAITASSLTGYEDIWSPTGIVRSPAMQLSLIRNLFVDNAGYNMEGIDGEQPGHFDNASTLATGTRSVETNFATTIKNAVSNMMTRYSTFIRNQSGTTPKLHFYATMKASDWAATSNAEEFIEFWRYVLRTELGIPVATYTKAASTWSAKTYAFTNLGALQYGCSLKLRCDNKAGATDIQLSKYKVQRYGQDSADAAAAFAAATDTLSATDEVLAIGTGANYIDAWLLGSDGTETTPITGGDDGDIITIYAN